MSLRESWSRNAPFWMWIAIAVVALCWHEWTFVALGIIMARLESVPAVVIIKPGNRR